MASGTWRVGAVSGVLSRFAATGDADTLPAALLWIAWGLAGILGLVIMAGAGYAYESSYGRSQAVIVMDTRCVRDMGDDALCRPDAQLSTVDTERDLGWVPDCAPPHGRGQRTEVLSDPRGWFKPQLSTCAGNGRALAVFTLVSAAFVAVLTLSQLVWIGGSWRRRRRRRR